MTSFSTKHIEYIERNYLDGAQGKVGETSLDFLMPDTDSIRVVKILGILRFWEQYEEKIVTLRYLMEDIAAGLYAEKTPLIYLIIGEPPKINLFIGTYQIEHSSNRTLPTPDESLSTLKVSLQSAYPGIDFLKEQRGDDLFIYDLPHLQDMINTLNYAGIVMGTPTTKVGTDEIGVEQIERLIRGMWGTKWGYMVIAMPVDDQDVIKLYNSTLNELRIVADEEESCGMQSPISVKYKELLNVFLKKIEVGKTRGMWHTAVYFLSQDVKTFNHAKVLIKSVFGGEESRPDPVQVLECHNLKEKIHQFAQITTLPPPPLGKIQYPYKYLNLLNSKELASFGHLSTEEMPGYFVDKYVRFGLPTPQEKVGAIEIGEITDRGKKMGYNYQIELDDLKRHGLIVGTTGSGKTNTIFHLIKQIWQRGIPFMVIEPAKTEYRKLLQSELGRDMQVFTLGDDTTSPFRLNPFEIMPGVSVQTHIDHLKSVFNACFYMFAPMPYVLERCIHEIYEDKGWDLVTNENERGFHRNAQPTLTDLYRKIDEVVDKLGYGARITMDVKAALETRIDSLRIGGKGLMLDTRKSIPIEKLIQKQTILEIQQIGDDDEKAFLIGLLLTFLYEYYVSKGLKEGTSLNHITIVEEAHRLFKNVPITLDKEVANIKGKAVETFCNILSEIRAYGEGFLIAEQIPIKLAPDIVKNTNLKVMHRIVVEDDRILMGGSMNLKDDEERYITSLKVGEAAVYSEGDDSSILVKVPEMKIKSQLDKDEEERIIHETMKGLTEEIAEVFVPFESCLTYCKYKCKYKKEAVDIVEDPEFKEILLRYIISIVVHDSALIEEFPQLIQSINKLRKGTDSNSGIVLCTLINGIDYYFERRGQQYGWKYSDVDALKGNFLSLIYDIVLERYDKSSMQSSLSDGERNSLISFQNMYKNLCKSHYYPFSGCERICPDNLCLYRYNVAPLLSDARLDRKFSNVLSKNSGDEMWAKLGKVCQVAVRRVIADSAAAEEKRKVGVCFAVQKSESRPDWDSYLREKIAKSMSSSRIKWE